MPTLEKAVLWKLKDRKSDDPPGSQDTDGVPITVQFNPNTLKLTLANELSDGKTPGTQTRQFLGKSSTELTFELQFDTADEGTSVRERTTPVELLLRPNPSATKPAPARVRFLWGDLRVDGVISSLAIDFDLFAANGVPLRAKMGVTIKEQDVRYETWQRLEGDKQGAGAGPSAAGPGSIGGALGDLLPLTGIAKAGETAADFARRMGLDPQAWRGLAGGLANPLSLQGGLAIDFSANLSVSAGLTGQIGFAADASASLEASFGLAASTTAGAGPTERGFKLAAAGGVSAALETVKVIAAETAASQARSAFNAPSPPVRPGQRGAATVPAAVAGAARLGASVQPGMPDQARAPLRLQGESASSRTSVPFPQADRRAATYGSGVPLRPLVGTPADAPVVVRSHAPRPLSVQLLAPASGCLARAGCDCGCGGA